MTLTAGTTLGPYEIVAPLGAGGMGEARQSPVIGRQSSVGRAGGSRLTTDDDRLRTDDWRPKTARLSCR